MFDMDSLDSAVIGKINATSALSSLHGEQVAQGYIAEGTARPKCRLSVVGDALDGMYGGSLLSSVRYQFSVFADTKAVATGLQKSLVEAFHGAVLSLSGGTSLGCRLVEGRRLLVEGQIPTNLVYHAIVVIEFRVLN